MLIKRELLAAVLNATTNDDTRFCWNAVHVVPPAGENGSQTPGKVVATNEHILLIGTDDHAIDDADFPTKGIPAFAGQPDQPVNIDAGTIAGLLKTIGKGKRQTIPVLGAVQVAKTTDGSVYAAATDLSAVMAATVDTSENAPRFPSYDRVLPAADRAELIVNIGVPVLEAMIKAAKAIGADTVTLGVPTGARSADYDKGALVSAFRVGMKHDGLTVDGGRRGYALQAVGAGQWLTRLIRTVLIVLRVPLCECWRGIRRRKRRVKWHSYTRAIMRTRTAARNIGARWNG